VETRSRIRNHGFTRMNTDKKQQNAREGDKEKSGVYFA
jgi:hypothetical protein